ncbi:hypothetical protein BLX87_10270 [Bacillus sp. VT-16-64]|nr:hypothetical protein BLX87_10270 [Bacillus sp. VT-16-64]
MDKKIFSLALNGKKKEMAISRVYAIGYAGRDKKKTMDHIKELEEIGVPRPIEIPTLYPLSLNNVTQNKVIEVVGDKTSGEAEIVIIFGERTDEIYVTVGSDHTDRELEATDIHKSKQVCQKPFATKAWNLKDVIQHWDLLELSSDIYINHRWIPYQKDKISSILSFEDIMKFLERKGVPLANSIFFSGTVPLKCGFKYGEQFRMTITDPIHKRNILMEYTIKNLLGSVQT